MVTTKGTLTLEEQLWCARRELRMRKTTYPALVRDGQMLADTAAYELDTMRAIVDTLTALCDRRQHGEAGSA